MWRILSFFFAQVFASNVFIIKIFDKKNRGKWHSPDKIIPKKLLWKWKYNQANRSCLECALQSNHSCYGVLERSTAGKCSSVFIQVTLVGSVTLFSSLNGLIGQSFLNIFKILDWIYWFWCYDESMPCSYEHFIHQQIPV